MSSSPRSSADSSAHPYFDAKTDKDSPTWYMVSVRFLERLPHPVTLSAVKSLVGLTAVPAGIEYIGVGGLKAVQGMALINRGRLSESAPPLSRSLFIVILTSPHLPRGSLSFLTC